MVKVVHASEMKKLPRYLYHGTECKNVRSICEKGLHVGTYKTCNPYTEETGLGQSFVEDCIGNVSMATKENDAIFFIVANRKTKEEWQAPQCIFQIDTTRLDEDKLFFRDLMSTKLGEAKYFDDVPMKAITSFKVRSFDKDKKGKTIVVEKEHYCPYDGEF